jgi:hypothetical protein
MTNGARRGRTPLPQPPDFDVIEHASRYPGERRMAWMALIGDLNFAWSNNESLFIYVLMLLLDTDEPAAAIVFATLNTTRARLDLVERLAKIRLNDRALSQELNEVTKAFSASTRLRNELNHATFVLNETGDITHTQAMKLEERRGNLRFGAREPVDDARMAKVATAVAELYTLNRRIWTLLGRLDAAHILR